MKINKIIKWLVFTIILGIPVIIKAKVINFIAPKLEPIILKTGVYVRIYDHLKFDFLFWLFIFLIIAFCIKLFFDEIKIITVDYFLFSLILLLLASTFLSEYLPIAFQGTYSRLDGSLFYIISFLLVFMVSKIPYEDKDIDRLFLAFIPFFLVNLLISFLGIKNIDILNSDLFKKMILSSDSFEVNAGSYIVSTFENPNYLSGFSGFLMVLFFMSYLLNNNEGIIYKSYYFLGTISAFFLLISSFSSSGLVALLLTLIFILAFLYQRIEFSKLLFRSFSVLIPVVAIYIYLIRANARVKQEYLQIKNIVFSHLNYILILLVSILLISFILKKIKISKKGFYIINLSIAVLILVGLFIFPNSSFYQKEYPDKIYTEDEIRKIVDEKEIRGDMFSGRIDPWLMTMDLIKEKPLLGYGMSTYPYEFRQQSIFERGSSWPTTSVFDKPHNMYLTFAYGSGVFALIIFILIYLNIIIKTIGKLRTNFASRDLVLFAGLILFLIQGMINDPSIGSFPVFMIFTGVLISRTNFREDKEFDKK